MRDSRAPSLGPALIVVAVAAVVVFGGIGLSFAFGGGAPSPSGQTGASGAGTTDGLAAVPATQALAVIAADGEPPTDIGSSLVVPEGATVSSHENLSAGLAPFDSAITLSVAAAPASVVSFYKKQLTRHGWGLLPQGVQVVPGNGTELFYKKAGSDGYYWEVAVTVTSQNPSITPALGGGDQTAPTSRVELELVQAEDAD